MTPDDAPRVVDPVLREHARRAVAGALPFTPDTIRRLQLLFQQGRPTTTSKTGSGTTRQSSPAAGRHTTHVRTDAA